MENDKNVKPWTSVTDANLDGSKKKDCDTSDHSKKDDVNASEIPKKRDFDVSDRFKNGDVNALESSENKDFDVSASATKSDVNVSESALEDNSDALGNPVTKKFEDLGSSKKSCATASESSKKEDFSRSDNSEKRDFAASIHGNPDHLISLGCLCKCCGRVFPHISKFICHLLKFVLPTTMSLVKRDEEPEQNDCDICNNGFPSMKELREHVNGDSSGQKRVKKHRLMRPEQFLCGMCSKTYICAKNLRAHIHVHSERFV